MRILLASETYYPNINGAAVFTRRLAQALHREGHTVGVVAPSSRFQSAVEIDEGIRIYRVRSLPILLHPDYRLPMPDETRLMNIVDVFRPDILHIQNHFTIGRAMLRAAKRFCLPILGTNHFMPEGMLHYLMPQSMGNLVKPLTWRQCIGTLNKLEYVTSPTQAAVDLLLAQGLKTPAEAISNGVDVAFFRPRDDQDALRQRFSLPDKPTVLYTGRVEQEKRLDVWIEAIPHVLAQVDAHFVIVGNGKAEKWLQRRVEELGVADHVTFLGFLINGDLPAVYGTAQVFAIASEVELQSIVSLEAAASGLPIVAAKALALPELVADGDNGFLFPPGDAETMGQQIAAILRNPILGKAMGQRSRRLAESHTLSRTVERYLTVYERVLLLHQMRTACGTRWA